MLMMAAGITACSGPKAIEREYASFSRSDTPSAEIVAQLPRNEPAIRTVKGKAKSFVSEPNHSDRATVLFESNRDSSRVTFKNRIGIQGGEMLVSPDSVLIYNKIDKYARKFAVEPGQLTQVDGLASINIISLLNYRVRARDVSSVLENEDSYLLILKDRSRVYVGRESMRVSRVLSGPQRDVPYSQIDYAAYGDIEGFTIPRKITIYSTDRQSKVVLLLQDLEINPSTIDLELTIPENITIRRS